MSAGADVESALHVVYAKATIVESVDSDSDGLADATEAAVGTDPDVADSDGDGLLDGDEEIFLNTSALVVDSDGDGFGDGLEVAAGSDPLSSDIVPVTISGTIVNGTPLAGAVRANLFATNVYDFVTNNTAAAQVSRAFSAEACPAAFTFTNATASGTSFRIEAWADVNGNGTQESWEPAGVYESDGVSAPGVAGVEICLTSKERARISGKVTAPKTWKVGQSVTWKATAEKGGVFAHWEGDFVDSLNLSRNELRNPSLKFSVPEGFDTNTISAVFISIDSDGLSELALSTNELAAAEAVSGLELLDDSESYVTAKVSGLPSGLKFDAKTLAITGTPKTPGVYAVKITAKNASGYQWAENVDLRVTDIADSRIAFEDLPDGNVGEEYSGKIDAGEFKTLKVKGLPTGLKFDAKTGAVAGTPKKGGYFTVTATATYVDRSKSTATHLLTVRPIAEVEPKRTAYHPLTVIATNSVEGSATGTGIYAEGRRVTVSAKPAKGYVFAGWYRDAALSQEMSFASGDWRKASQSVIVPEVRYLFARFVTLEDDKASIVLSVNGEEMSSDSVPVYTNYCGVALTWPVEAEALSAPTVKASGLPSGVKLVLDKKTGAYSLAGAPTAASKVDNKTGEVKPFRVKLTVTTAGRSSVVFEMDWVIEALPSWAVGTFDGAAFDADDASVTGQVSTLKIAANGKISGKLLESGSSLSLSASSFDAVEEDGDVVSFLATLVGKVGKAVVTNEVTVSRDDTVEFERGVVACDASPLGWYAWQNLWKTEPWKTTAKPFAKAPKLELYMVEEDSGLVLVDTLPEGGVAVATITLKFASSGVVKAAGKFVTGQNAKGRDIVHSTSCSASLVPVSATEYVLYLYFPPKPGKFDGYSAAVPLAWDGSSFTLSVFGEDAQSWNGRSTQRRRARILTRILNLLAKHIGGARQL